MNLDALDRKLAEEWRRIPNYSGYEVSNYGRVRSWRHKNGLRKNPYILKLNNTGVHYMVQLYINGKCYPKYVHRLVLTVFVGPCPMGMECCHNDGNGFNNYIENLRWDTRSNNTKDMIRHGTVLLGSLANSSRLLEEDIPKIRDMFHKDKKTFKAIANIFNVNNTTISRIIKGITWKHI